MSDPGMTAAAALWGRYLETLPATSHVRLEPFTAESWGDSPALADELGALIATGVKTATCAALWELEASGNAVPQVGRKTVVLDGAGIPLCIIETTEVVVRPFATVDAAFAASEGEGDRSYEYWERGHRDFFSRTLAAIGRTFDPQMPLICERFRLVYPLPG